MHQGRQHQQVFNTEQRSPGRYHHKRVRCRNTGPDCRQGTQATILVVERYPLLAPGITIAYQLKFLSIERMERVYYSEKPLRTLRFGCN